MANVLTVVWFVIGCVVFQTALLVWAALMLPGPVGRARRRIELKPAASFFWGLLFWTVTLVFAGALIGSKNGGGQLIGWTLASPMLAGAVVGGAAFARMLADRIRTQMRSDSGILALVGGALCATLPGWLPILGWFLYLPVTGLISIGAGLLGLFSRRELEPRPAPQPVPAPQPAPYPEPQPGFAIPGE